MINIREFGYNYENENTETDFIPARITQVHKERYILVSQHGESSGVLKASVYYNNCTEDFPAVGDFVLINYNEYGDSPIVKTLPRKSYFTRSNDFGKIGEQAVAANFDYVFILMSLNKDFNIARLERYMAMAWQSGAIPLVVLTKADLCDDVDEYVAEATACAIGAEIIAVSAVTGEGVERIKNIIKSGETAVFLGSSGAGKSTLINCITGENLMETGEIREDDARGRHTTTHRQLIMAKDKFMLIDTPGMRELGLWDAAEGLSEAFLDIDELESACRFSNCTHTNEIGCAVIQALNSGALSEERWKRYLKLQRENLRSENKLAYSRMWREKMKKVEKSHRVAYKSGKNR